MPKTYDTKQPAALPRQPTKMPRVFAPVDEILHHQKVTGVALLNDDVQFVFHARNRFGAARMAGGITRIETVLAQFAQKRNEIVAGGHIEVGKVSGF